jgi:uncharacterized protein YoxC
MKRNLKIVLIGLCFLFTTKDALAQFFPVQSTFYLKPPYPVYLSDYASPLGDQLSLKVLLRDLNLGPTQVYFKFSIKGPSVGYSNNLSPVGKPIFTLVPGAVQTFTQAELSEYFTAISLGISPSAYANVLQEGVYNFSVQVIDVLTNKPLSKIEQSPPVWLVVNDPPILNFPENQSILKYLNPQNILFQWSPRHRQANTVEYEFTLTELIIPDNFRGNPQNMFLSQPAFYQARTPSTSLLYGPALPPLTIGRTYGFRVRSIAKQGLSEVGVFRNEGYSEIFTFRYEKNVAPILTSAAWTQSGQVELSWTGASVHESFELQIQYDKEDNFQTLKTEDNNGATGQVTKKALLNIPFGSTGKFRVGGKSFYSGEPILYSNIIVLDKAFNPQNLEISSIYKDYNSYFGALLGKVNKENPNPLTATCSDPTVNPTNQQVNGVEKGDILTAGGHKLEVIDEEYALSEIQTVGNPNPLKVKLYYSPDFQINEYNEVIIGFLSSSPTNHKLSLIERTTNGNSIVPSNIIEIGKEVDSLKTVANTIFDKVDLMIDELARKSNTLTEVETSMVQLGSIFQQKDASIEKVIVEINGLSNKKNNSKNQSKQLDALKTIFAKYKKENLENITVLESFQKTYSSIDLNSYALLLRKLFSRK